MWKEYKIGPRVLRSYLTPCGPHRRPLAGPLSEPLAYLIVNVIVLFVCWEVILSTLDHAKEPCPDRILYDIGGAFSVGAVGGSSWHFIRGKKSSPQG
jgi:hypothetical protein